MALRVYNTLSRQKEDFRPLNPPQVKMYCCGPTVYGLLHVGNFRGAVFYNLVVNWLEKLGYKVTYVYNFTDVDDKILNRAKEEGLQPREVSEKYIEEFYKDFGALELRPHDVNPKVTESMPDIIKTIESLIECGHAYVANGEVLYDVSSFKEYGKLSNRKTDELLTGVRVEIGENKRSPLDFALWKPAKPGEQSWESPWSPGRPGWHIECTSMIQSILGDEIDIHGGGLDLVFPHHENEIAQGEGCTGKRYVKYWLHNNMITFGGSKMSKSVGNIQTMRSFLESYSGEIFKYLILSVHYRSECEFSESTIRQAIKGLAKFYSALSLAEEILSSAQDEISLTEKPEVINHAEAHIRESLNDDFNTAEMFASFYEVLRWFNTEVKRGQKITNQTRQNCLAVANFYKEYGRLCSLFQKPAHQFLIELDNLLLDQKGLERNQINQMVEERLEARRNKNFARADEIRNQLSEMGIAVQDLGTTSRWEVAK